MAVFNTNISLRQGSKGENVKTLQTHLKTLGYYNKAIDGIYGTYTTAAVKAFQRAYKLTADGWFGPVTCKKFNEVIESKNTTTTSNTGNAPFDCPNTNLKKGSKNDKVKTLQTILKQWGYYTRQVDGDYGTYTTAAVKKFQKDNGHTQDGWFGPKTCKSLVSRYQKENNTNNTTTNTSNTTKTGLTPIPKQHPTYKLVVHPETVVLPENTVETSESTNSDGSTVTKTTQSLTGGSINTDTNFNCQTINLKKGSKGADVTKLQTILKARGYYNRQIDGDYGTYTVAAVKRLQKVQGNTQDGWFGPKTCNKLQSTSTTSSNNTGTSDTKNKDYTITNFTTTPQLTNDMEGISHEVTLKIPYSTDVISHIRKLQKTTFSIIQEETTLTSHEGYINNIKITHENNTFLIEVQLIGYTAFLEQTVMIEEKTAKRSELLKELIEMAGLKPNVNLAGLNDDEYTLKVTKANISTGSNEAGGLTTLSGNDCTATNPISGYGFDIDTCKGGTKIGNSSANYAQDTKNMTAKEAIKDIYNRFVYYKPMYADNRFCPQKMWNKSGKITGNCADISRLVKCVGEVHGLKVGIHHWHGGGRGHYFNLIEVNGQVYRFDCCFKSGVSSGYGNEICNNLTKRGGPWE